jgi:uracil phosphoribosyltransferase
MLATGGSICMALGILKRWGVRDIRILSLLGTPEGIAQVHQAHPEVRIWVASIDRELNAVNYILPGLGDAGDRQFNTLIR